jgi:protein involved in polysaccharide export with SLBB domain
MIEIGKIRSLNIYFSGEVFEPGIHLIHPFSDVFMSLSKAGGVKKTGSLRKVEILRGGELLDTIDFYQLFNQGENNFTNIRLIDGDVINVPVVKNKISISGEVNRPMTYELKDEESLEDLISYAAGLTPLSSNNIFVKTVIPISERSSDDNAFSSYNVKLIDSKSTFLNNGDSVKVIGVGEVESTLSIYGRVKNPGEYSAVNATLKDILDIAGGFDDLIFRKTINDEIIVLRKNENAFYGEEIIVNYNESSSITLQPGDKIFVYENINYKNSFTYRVEGEVNKPGTFPLRNDITLSQALKLAGGITENGSLKSIFIFQEFTSIDDNGDVSISESPVGNARPNFILSANSVVKVLPFESVIRVEGNVYSPGLIAMNDDSVSMYKAIELAGGKKPYTPKRSSYVLRANGEIEKSKLLQGRFLRVYPGDTIIVPVDPDPNPFDITTFIADISTTLANIAAILVVIENNN